MAFPFKREVLLREIQCKWCAVVFLICRSCYRGQVYCCKQCRKLARLVAHRKAQSTYRRSPKGRKANRLAARRRRIRVNEKTVADHTSTQKAFSDTLFSKPVIKAFCCIVCGITGPVVKHFPRRGYGGRTGRIRSDLKSASPVFEPEDRRSHDNQPHYQSSESPKNPR